MRDPLFLKICICDMYFKKEYHDTSCCTDGIAPDTSNFKLDNTIKE